MAGDLNVYNIGLEMSLITGTAFKDLDAFKNATLTAQQDITRAALDANKSVTSSTEAQARGVQRVFDEALTSYRKLTGDKQLLNELNELERGQKAFANASIQVKAAFRAMTSDVGQLERNAKTNTALTENQLNQLNEMDKLIERIRSGQRDVSDSSKTFNESLRATRNTMSLVNQSVHGMVNGLAQGHESLRTISTPINNLLTALDPFVSKLRDSVLKGVTTPFDSLFSVVDNKVAELSKQLTADATSYVKNTIGEQVKTLLPDIDKAKVEQQASKVAQAANNQLQQVAANTPNVMDQIAKAGNEALADASALATKQATAASDNIQKSVNAASSGASQLADVLHMASGELDHLKKIDPSSKALDAQHLAESLEVAFSGTSKVTGEVKELSAAAGGIQKIGPGLTKISEEAAQLAPELAAGEAGLVTLTNTMGASGVAAGQLQGALNNAVPALGAVTTGAAQTATAANAAQVAVAGGGGGGLTGAFSGLLGAAGASGGALIFVAVTLAEIALVVTALQMGFANLGKSLEAFKTDTYRATGSVYELADSVNHLQSSLGASQDEAIATVKSLTHVGFNAKNLVGVVDAYGNKFTDAQSALNAFAESNYKMALATGISSDTIAQFQRRLTLAGESLAGQQAILGRVRGAIKEYGLTANEASDILVRLTKNAAALELAFGATTTRKLTNELLILSGAAKKAGIDVSDVTGIVDDLARSPNKFAAALGGDLLAGPEKQLQALERRGADVFKMMEGKSPLVAGSIAKAFGMTTQQVIALNEAFKEQQRLANDPAAKKRFEDDQVAAKAFNDAITSIVQSFKKIAGALEAAFSRFALPFFQLMQGALETIAEYSEEIASILMFGIKATLISLAAMFAPILLPIYAIWKVLTAVFEVGTAFKILAGGLALVLWPITIPVAAAYGIFKLLSPVVSRIWDGFKGIAGSVADFAKWVGKIGLVGLSVALTPVVSIVYGLTIGVQKLFGMISDVVSKIGSAFGSIFGRFSSLVGNTISPLVTSISNFMTGVADWIAKIWEKVKGFLSTINPLFKLAMWVMNGDGSKVEEAATKAAPTAAAVIGDPNKEARARAAISENNAYMARVQGRHTAPQHAFANIGAQATVARRTGTMVMELESSAVHATPTTINAPADRMSKTQPAQTDAQKNVAQAVNGLSTIAAMIHEAMKKDDPNVVKIAQFVEKYLPKLDKKGANFGDHSDQLGANNWYPFGNG